MQHAHKGATKGVTIAAPIGRTPPPTPANICSISCLNTTPAHRQRASTIFSNVDGCEKAGRPDAQTTRRHRPDAGSSRQPDSQTARPPDRPLDGRRNGPTPKGPDGVRRQRGTAGLNSGRVGANRPHPHRTPPPPGGNPPTRTGPASPPTLNHLATGCSWNLATRLSRPSQTTLPAPRPAWIKTDVFDQCRGRGPSPPTKRSPARTQRRRGR
jgi:hypothetical protein